MTVKEGQRFILTMLAGLIAVSVGFGLGFMMGRADVLKSTIVKVGSPYYTAGTFFGKCARIMSGDANFQACATERSKADGDMSAASSWEEIYGGPSGVCIYAVVPEVRRPAVLHSSIGDIEVDSGKFPMLRAPGTVSEAAVGSGGSIMACGERR